MFYTISLTISTLAIAANLIVLLLIWKKTKVTFICLLLSLSFADLITASSFAVESIMKLNEGHNQMATNSDASGLLIAAMMIFGIISSLWHVIVIATDRYWSIFHPISHRVFFTSKENTRVIVLLWLISGVHTTLFVTAVKYLDKNILQWIHICVGVFLGAIGATIVIIYVLIINRVCKMSKEFDGNSDNRMIRHTGLSTSKTQHCVIINCILVTAAFICCRYPAAIERMKGKTHFPAITNHLLLSNALLDPLIHVILNYIRKWLSKA